MRISHSVAFDVTLSLPHASALEFVRDARQSLSKATFVEDLTARAEAQGLHIGACIPVNAALFGQRRLRFESVLRPTPNGAMLQALELNHDRPGWAQVSGRADVRSHPAGALARYRFDVTIHLKLPAADKWGAHALVKMIRFTAKRMLETISSEFPVAVQQAAREVEKVHHEA